MERPLSSDEAALWARVLETVRPLRVAPKPVARAVAKALLAAPAPRTVAAPDKRAAGQAPGAAGSFEKLLELGVGGRVSSKRTVAHVNSPAALPGLGRGGTANTLDGSWDRRLARGLVSPDCAVDLHGHNLSTAYATLDGALERSIRIGDRVILLVTGKPPRAESERPHARGAIRAAIGDWLAGSRHASAIAAVRGAHPRHGGAGALYVILKRADPNRVY